MIKWESENINYEECDEDGDDDMVDDTLTENELKSLMELYGSSNSAKRKSPEEPKYKIIYWKCY